MIAHCRSDKFHVKCFNWPKICLGQILIYIKLICAPLPYGQHQRCQLKQAGQRSQDNGSYSRRAHGVWAHQRRKKTRQSQSQEDETAEEDIQEGAEGGAGKCLHLDLVLHLVEENRKINKNKNPQINLTAT